MAVDENTHINRNCNFQTFFMAVLVLFRLVLPNITLVLPHYLQNAPHKNSCFLIGALRKTLRDFNLDAIF